MKTFYITLAIIACVMIIYHFVIRPKMLRRGVAKNETGRRLAGDEIIRQKPFRSTMAVNLNASPEDIWPWLIQIGWSKAAFYSYNRIESILGMDLHNADHIHPEWQDLNVGDTM
ncbi:MAG: hypothetical protein KJP14_00770, partial [Eudoraea sp.]|nr:hypothetical protein [Eudoraea sp.]